MKVIRRERSAYDPAIETSPVFYYTSKGMTLGALGGLAATGVLEAMLRLRERFGRRIPFIPPKYYPAALLIPVILGGIIGYLHGVHQRRKMERYLNMIRGLSLPHLRALQLKALQEIGSLQRRPLQLPQERPEDILKSMAKKRKTKQ